MKTLLAGSLVLACLSATLAQDATCGAGESETTVTIGAEDSFKYKTSARGKYKHNVNCVVNYLMDETCAEMKFSCKKINIKNKKDCSNGDTLVISTEDEEKVVCGKKKKFVFTSTSDMVVEFTSNGKKAGAGAKGCKVTCSQAAAATTTTTTTTGAPATASTGAPTTTTEAPTTTTTAATGAFSPFLACTGGELRSRLEAALVECDQYFVTTTIVGGRALGEDQGEERQSECQTPQQVEEYFNITLQASLCLYSALDWLDNDQSLVDMASLRPGLTDWSDWLEPWGQCLTRTEQALRESYAGCGYTEEDWVSLEKIFQLSANIQCTSEIFSQECESALSDNFNDQPTSTTDHSFAETTEECTNTGEVCYDSDYNISTTCCKPNLCSMVNTRTAICQDFSETTAYPSFTETTDQECSNTGEVCYDSDYNINTSCCKPNLCSMVNTRTATCQDFSETTAYPSFTETTTACSNAAQSVALGAACCALTDCAEGFCDLFGGDAGAPTNVCTAI